MGGKRGFVQVPPPHTRRAFLAGRAAQYVFSLQLQHGGVVGIVILCAGFGRSVCVLDFSLCCFGGQVAGGHDRFSTGGVDGCASATGGCDTPVSRGQVQRPPSRLSRLVVAIREWGGSLLRGTAARSNDVACARYMDVVFVCCRLGGGFLRV